MLGGGSAGLDREGGSWKTLRLAARFCILLHKQENPVLLRDNFCDHITPNIWPPNSSLLQSSWLLFVGCNWAKNQQTPFITKDELKAKINGSIYQFKQGDPRKDLQEIPKSCWCRSWSQWRFLWINLIYIISRYFRVILANIPDKVRCHGHFNFCIT